MTSKVRLEEVKGQAALQFELYLSEDLGREAVPGARPPKGAPWNLGGYYWTVELLCHTPFYATKILLTYLPLLLFPLPTSTISHWHQQLRMAASTASSTPHSCLLDR